MPFTVIDALEACGVPENIVFNGMNHRERLSNDIFDDTFDTCLTMTIEDLDNDLKIFSGLNVNQGQIRFHPRVQRNIRAMLQWAKEELLLGRDPTAIPFPIEESQRFIMCVKEHKAFISKSKTLIEAATPAQFTDKTK